MHDHIDATLTSEEVLRATLDRLAPLVGNWRGRGSGQYPTIDAFEYEEELRFDLLPSYPMLSMEQTTILRPSADPSHREQGYLRPVAEGVIDLSNTQDSGRVEVLRCVLPTTMNPDTGFELGFESVALAHDPRLVATRRLYRLAKNALSYQAFMATRTTASPRMLLHLSARLFRA